MHEHVEVCQIRLLLPFSHLDQIWQKACRAVDSSCLLELAFSLTISECRLSHICCPLLSSSCFKYEILNIKTLNLLSV